MVFSFFFSVRGITSARLPLEEIEKEAIVQTLRKTLGNKSEAAKLLNITRTTLNNKIKIYKIII